MYENIKTLTPFHKNVKKSRCSGGLMYMYFGIFSRPDSSQNFMNTVKTIALTRLCIQITNTVFFQSYTHQTYKEIQNKKHVNSKPKVLRNIVFTTHIHYL